MGTPHCYFSAAILSLAIAFAKPAFVPLEHFTRTFQLIYHPD